MRGASPIDSVRKLHGLFESWLELDEEEVEVRLSPDAEISPQDFSLQVLGHSFVGALRSRSDSATIAATIERFQRSELPAGSEPLLVVPFMGGVGAALCTEARISWIDLSGNAHVIAPPLFIHVEGKENQFKSPGRPPNVFAPKSSRIARFLLQHPTRHFTQAEIAERTGLTAGYTSRIVRRLEATRLLERLESGEVGVHKPDLLLDAWSERYDFSGHHIIAGTVAARQSRELLERIPRQLDELGGDYAATGLAAAWAMTRFASFRIATFFVEASPPEDWKRAIGLREDPTGANLWLVVPNDAGVFQGGQEFDGLRCVHPVQAYLDLQGHPERAEEAAQSIRDELLTWREG